jgi:hypothetical protein
MFRFTQEPSSGSYFVLSENYNYDSIVIVVNDVVNVMAAYQPVVQACGTVCFDTIDERCKHEDSNMSIYSANIVVFFSDDWYYNIYERNIRKHLGQVSIRNSGECHQNYMCTSY